MSKTNHDNVAKAENSGQGDNNPWQILVIAALFFIPGIVMLISTDRMVMMAPLGSGRFAMGPIQVETVSSATVHILGVMALVISGLIVLFYFRVRRAIKESDIEKNGKEGGNQDG